MLNWILSILVNKKVITLEEAQELSKELPLRTHPAGFTDAHNIIEEILTKLQNKK